MISRALWARHICLQCQINLDRSLYRVSSRIENHTTRSKPLSQQQRHNSSSPWKRMESVELGATGKADKNSPGRSRHDSFPELSELGNGPESIKTRRTSRNAITSAQGNAAVPRSLRKHRHHDTSLPWNNLQSEGTHDVHRAKEAPLSDKLLDSNPASETQIEPETSEESGGTASQWGVLGSTTKAHASGIGARRPGHRAHVRSRPVILRPEKIDATLLGQTAEPLIMREEKRTRLSRVVELDDPADNAAPEPSDSLHTQAEASRGAASNTEAYDNISELRPQNNLITQEEFEGLHQALVDGFNTEQLKFYIKKGSKGRQSRKAQSPLSQQPWMVSPPSFTPLHGLPALNPSRKGALASSIMSQIWALDIWERVQGINQIVVGFKDVTTMDMVQIRIEGPASLAGEYLQHDESIQFDRATSQLRILARRATGEAVIDRIGSLIGSISSEKFALYPSGAQQNKQELMWVPELGRLTGTLPTIDDSGFMSVLSIPDDQHSTDAESNTALESKGHAIWRLLHTSIPSSGSATVILPGFTSASDNVTLHPQNLDVDRVAWNHRQGQWHRWITPISREGTVWRDTAALAENAPSLLARPLSKPSSPASNANMEADVQWNSVQDKITVTFGHVLSDAGEGSLFKSNEISDEEGIRVQQDDSAAHPSRFFYPIVPPPNGLARLEAQSPETHITSTIILRFAAGINPENDPLLQEQPRSDSSSGWPSSPLHPSSVPKYTLELHLAIPRKGPSDGKLTWESSPEKEVRLVLDQQAYDIPLPDRPVDLRLVRSAISTLEDPDAVSALRDFVNSSYLDVHAGILQAPSRLHLPQGQVAVVSALAADTEPMPETGSSNPEQQSQDAPCSVPFGGLPLRLEGHESLEFIGLEVRRGVEVEYHGHKLTYTNIEAGLHGGRRAELSLDMVSPSTEGSKSVSRVAEQQKDFLDLARRLAEGSVIKWAGSGAVIGETMEEVEEQS